MSRSGYSEDCDNLVLWRGAVRQAAKGRRGQAFLRELIAALDAMPEKRLIAHDLKDESGAVCAIGSVGVARGMDMSHINVDSYQAVAKAFGIAGALAAEIEFENDDDFGYLAYANGKERTPEDRWKRMRAWAERALAGEID